MSALLHRVTARGFGAGLTVNRLLGGAALCGIGFTLATVIFRVSDAIRPDDAAGLEVRAILGDRVRYAWRHAPLTQIHPNALATAEASEAAAAQGESFDFARAVFDDQDHQQPQDIISMARKPGLDIDQFTNDLISANTASRVRSDILDAEAMNISAVPALFINGRRHNGQYGTQSLLHALTDQDGKLAARW